jgi:acyl phosphate:glycerol-3-phosphate acyltransferase
VGRIAFSVFLGYVIGSFPTAYLLVRWKSRIDIRKVGSGNVGTLNSFLVTRSWLVGGIVLVADVLKGVVAASIGTWLADGSMLHAAVAGISATAGHNYPVWLAFRGGRGLAPAAGAALVVCWVIVPAWLVLWAVAYAFVRTVNPANAIASGLLLFAAAVVPAESFGCPGGEADGGLIRWFTVGIMGVILLRHRDPLMEFVTQRKRSGREETRAQ